MIFRKEFYFLSNFFLCVVKLGGYWYPTAEHAYQAQKATNDVDHEKILMARSAREAKQIGSQIEIIPDWDNRKLEIMEKIVRAKFNQNSELMERLLLIDAEIIEDNNWGDCFWGRCDGRGENHLGKILMRIRDKEE